MSGRRKRAEWDAAPIVFVARPVCPACGAERYVSMRGTRSADGSITSRRVCSACDVAYVVISEPGLPESGNGNAAYAIFEGNKSSPDKAKL